MTRRPDGNGRGGRGRGNARGRGGGAGARGGATGRGTGRALQNRVTVARSQVIPPGFALVPVTQPMFPVSQASNLAAGMTNAAIHNAGFPADQGPRSALLMLINPIPASRNQATRALRKMDWTCRCTDMSCANNLSSVALQEVSNQQYYTWLVNHQLIWHVTYCTKPARVGRDAKVLGHQGAFALRMRLSQTTNRHVCPHPTCRAVQSHLGPLSNGYNWTTPTKLMHAALSFARDITLKEIVTETAISKTTLVKMRQDFDRLLAGVQFHRNRGARNSILRCQADEFCFGKSMYDRGDAVTAVGQQWFQSIAELDSEEKCVRFFIRPVSCRDTQTLCGWIAEMVANTAHVTTDQWGGYHGLRDLCAARGKTIVHHRVNHSAGFKNAEGKHTNVVECMHHQVRAIFDRVGQEWEKRTCRIMAACAVAQPGPDRRIVRFLRCVQKIVRRGFTFEDTLKQDLVSADGNVIYKMHVRYEYGGTTQYVTAAEVLDADEEPLDEDVEAPSEVEEYDSGAELPDEVTLAQAPSQNTPLVTQTLQELRNARLIAQLAPTLVLTQDVPTQAQSTVVTQTATQVTPTRALNASVTPVRDGQSRATSMVVDSDSDEPNHVEAVEVVEEDVEVEDVDDNADYEAEVEDEEDQDIYL